MASTPDTSNRFVLEVFDCTLWCPIAQAPFYPTDVGPLRSILGPEAADDAEIERLYFLDGDQIAAIVSAFGTFDPRQLDDVAAEIEIRLYRLPGTIEVPYLVHTGWELPLLLEGRKKLAIFSDWYPSPLFDCEEAFDRWVADGALHKEVIDVPFEKTTKWLGDRTVYYALKGEEWRIHAHKLIQDASGKSGGWNEHFQRLEGMLFGYEDWQNDWWINTLSERGAFGGATFCCAVTAAGLAWAESAGLRALPPTEALSVISYWRKTTGEDLKQLLEAQPRGVAVLRFAVAGLYAIPHIIDARRGGPWKVQQHQIPELNTYLGGPLVVVARTGQPT
jgi:hypothetical protein